MNKDYTNFLHRTFLFKEIDDDTIRKLIEGICIEERHYQKGEIVYSPEKFENKIGFILEGKCVISRQTQNGPIPLNSITIGDAFAITTVFSERDEFPTIVTANSNSAVIFISQNDIFHLISNDVRISLNVIKFLSKKIDFLNDKIAAFSAGTVEEKLVNYILILAKKQNSLVFDFNKKRSAEALNCGRASLYRAMDSLTQSGYVKFVDKKIYIMDLDGLERISK